MPASKSNAADDVDRPRRRAFIWLSIIVALRAVAPGAVNYLQVAHQPPSLTAVPQPPTHLAALLSIALTVILAAASVGVFTRFDGLRSRFGLSTWLLTGLACLAVLGNRFLNALSFRSLIEFLAFFGLILAIASIRPRLEDLRIIGVVGFVVASYALAFGILMPSKAMLPNPVGVTAETSKAIIGTSLLAGPMSHSNALGIFLTLALPFVSLWQSGGRKSLATLIIGVAVIWSASRTSLLAIAASACVLIAWRYASPGRTRAALATIALTAAGLAVIGIPLLFTDPMSFSGRGTVWQGGLMAWKMDGSRILGLGPYWAGSAGAGRGIGSDRTSGHNLFIQWLVTGGVLQVALGAMALTRTAVFAVSTERDRVAPSRTIFLLILLIISMTEFVIVFTVGSQLFPVTVFPIICILLGSTAGTPHVRGASNKVRRNGRGALTR